MNRLIVWAPCAIDQVVVMTVPETPSFAENRRRPLRPDLLGRFTGAEAVRVRLRWLPGVILHQLDIVLRDDGHSAEDPSTAFGFR